jgi:D-tyrosyl-tRNA(Tyr) deacylase
MRAFIQRVSSAQVLVAGAVSGKIDVGFLVLLGIESADTKEDAEWLSKKICALRVFNDEQGFMNFDLAQVNGQLLVVSQFTLHAKTKKGNRPSFIQAARPEEAIPLYTYFLECCAQITGAIPQQGVFGAHMQVQLVNDGPVSIWIDTKNKE